MINSLYILVYLKVLINKTSFTKNQLYDVDLYNNAILKLLSEMLVEGVSENWQCLDLEYGMLEPVFENQRDFQREH